PSLSATEPLIQARGEATLTALDNGQALVAGGREELYVDYVAECDAFGDCASYGGPFHLSVQVGFASSELYDPATRSWARTGSMHYPRAFHTATKLDDGTVLVAGGHDAGLFSANPYAAAEIYDPLSGTWHDTGSLHVAR